VASSFQRGFKTRAESRAVEIRVQLGLTVHDRLDPRALAGHLGIAVLTLHDLVACGASESAIQHFLEVAPEELSALTVTDGNERLIVENPNHSIGRRSSTLTHELSHIVLDHKPEPAIGLGGCRRWNQQQEDEADWQAAVLLVPRPAALRYARLETPIEVAAYNLGVSTTLMRWRLNQSGALVQARRARVRRAP